MEHATYASRLQYLDADDVDDSTIDFSQLEVRGHDNTKLGDIDGFIVDSASGRLHHLVVDSGGWFSSRRFLLPIGHATVDRDARAVRVDVTRDAIERYPEFDADRFRTFSDDDLRAFERRTVEACCPDDTERATAGSWPYESQRHFSQPAWWGAGIYSRERLRPVETGVYREGTGEVYDRELITARERGDRENVTRRPDEESPHYEGRAQPGDVLGLESGGERTYVGETSEDENKRRRDAKEAVRRDREGRKDVR
jgi:PRC-barrel domain